MIIMPGKEGENIEKAHKKIKQYFTKPSIAKREAMQHAIYVAYMNRDVE